MLCVVMLCVYVLCVLCVVVVMFIHYRTSIALISGKFNLEKLNQREALCQNSRIFAVSRALASILWTKIEGGWSTLCQRKEINDYRQGWTLETWSHLERHAWVFAALNLTKSALPCSETGFRVRFKRSTIFSRRVQICDPRGLALDKYHNCYEYYLVTSSSYLIIKTYLNC